MPVSRSRKPRTVIRESRGTRRTGQVTKPLTKRRNGRSASRRTMVGTRPRRSHTMPRTGARRAARLKETLAARAKTQEVEFEDLGDFDDAFDNTKEGRDRRADDRRLRQDHPGLFATQDE